MTNTEELIKNAQQLIDYADYRTMPECIWAIESCMIEQHELWERTSYPVDPDIRLLQMRKMLLDSLVLSDQAAYLTLLREFNEALTAEIRKDYKIFNSMKAAGAKCHEEEACGYFGRTAKIKITYFYDERNPFQSKMTKELCSWEEPFAWAYSQWNIDNFGGKPLLFAKSERSALGTGSRVRCKDSYKDLIKDINCSSHFVHLLQNSLFSLSDMLYARDFELELKLTWGSE